MNLNKTLTQIQLKELMSYDSEAGVLIWKRHREKARIGKQAGTKVQGSRYKTSYLIVRILGKTYYIHQLIWLYETGKLPDYELDHKDRNGLNNKFSNLREATRSQQGMNKAPQINSASGVTGVTPFKNKWQVSIKKDGFKHHLGTFSSFDKAVEVRKIAEKALFKEFAYAID